jgi:thiol:disulfide interchange protein DsbD
MYGLSIVLLYVLIGTAVSRINGPEFANFVSTHWVPNVFFFLVFLLFGLSFLGLFEIVLPSSLVNMADRQSDKGGIYGIFFMAFTIVLVSFSCTGPIVGSILVESAGGAVLKPIIGMLGYSLAFALPFTLFAIFPQWLTGLPKSGGWLNSVKVVLGFLELAFALKFLSIADLAYHWHLLDREVYLAAWIVIFSLMGFYLLGKIRLPHDSVMEKIPVMRLALAILVFSFVVYMIPGMWGAPLRALSGYLPPESTQDFRWQSAGPGTGHSPSSAAGLCDAPRHADILHLPHEIQGYFDIKQALACAKEKNKPVFIDFTGHGCVNCREMEANVWSHPEVLKRLKEDFVVTALYVDDKTELSQNEWYVSPYDQKEKKTIGKQNADLQVRDFKSNTQPLYVLLAPDGSLLAPPRSYDLDVEGFVKFLESGKEKLRGEGT